MSCVVTAMRTEAELDSRRPTLRPALCESHLRRAAAGILKTIREAVKNFHAAELGGDGMGDEQKTAVSGSSERTCAVTLWVRFSENVYAAARKEYYLQKKKTPLETISVCFLVSCSPDERSTELSK